MNPHTYQCPCQCPCRATLRSRLATGLRLAGRWLATPPGTPVRPPRPTRSTPVAGSPRPVRPSPRRSGSWDDDPALPVDPLAMYEDPDAFLRSVFSQDFGRDVGEDR
jgi:hypothetical protein